MLLKKMLNSLSVPLFLILFVFLPIPGRATGSDWPTYRGGKERSGYTHDKLPGDLALKWIRKSHHSPCPAWSGRDTRMHFDYAYHTVISGGTLFFGSSADCKVYALDAETGGKKWTFFSGGPVRFAPVIQQENVFVACEDGFLYCLDAATGKIRWKIRGGPSESQVLGNDRMISRWPVRGGPVVADGILYFAAGIWPSEGIYIYAVNAKSGNILWCNKDSGSIYMPQPHGTANAKSGVSAQGDLVVSGDCLLVPTGRAVPAAFNRGDGSLRYFHLQRYSPVGGSFVVSAGSCFINGGRIFSSKTGFLLHRGFGAASAVTVTPSNIIIAAGNNLIALDFIHMWTTKTTFDRKGNKITTKVLNNPAWKIMNPIGSAVSMISTDDAIILGGRDRVCILDTASRKKVFEARIDGTAYGLAVASGHLYVSTDKGTIFCFAGKTKNKPRVIKAKITNPYSNDKNSKIFAAAASEILKKTGIKEGYCLDIDCGTGELAYELAKQSKLHIYAIDNDPHNVLTARKRLDAAGLYGVRVTVHQEKRALQYYPDYFANLVVSGKSVTQDTNDTETTRSFKTGKSMRFLLPYRGALCIGKPGAMKYMIRGPLAGAGNWTHQYCNPANTTCSTDTIARGPLRILWFRDTDFVMPSRHGRGPAPLFLDGRLFVEGLNAIRCVDSYNGHTIWEYPLPKILSAYDQEHLMGVSGTGSNFCVSGKGLYVRRKDSCLRIDPASGRLLAEFKAPLQRDGKTGKWGFIACAGNNLFGSLSDTHHVVKWRFGRSNMDTQFTESILLFALDAETGDLKWTYKPVHAIRNNTIAFGKKCVFFIDGPEQVEDCIIQPTPQNKKKEKEKKQSKIQPSNKLIALNQVNGTISWKETNDIFGTMTLVSNKYDTLLMAYQDTRFKLKSETGGRLAAFCASTGKRLWDIQAKYGSRPLLNDRTIYAQPGAWDLLTGKRNKDFSFSRSYGCGILAGSRNLLVYRSATLGYTDLSQKSGNKNYGGIRPGCWINTLPVGGLVLMPDATSRCVCSYLMSASIALQPVK